MITAKTARYIAVHKVKTTLDMVMLGIEFSAAQGKIKIKLIGTVPSNWSDIVIKLKAKGFIVKEKSIEW